MLDTILFPPLMPSPRYLVTARKYRPTSFSELVGQEHVSETLKNAIRTERLAHAYLFSGPRGVGKTTAARILAKAINCQTPREARPDGAEPCGVCESCRSFAENRSLNIIEIDAASNNKVDDIRELRDTVRVPPQGAKKKVYIVDEVHMLSTSAFNALLKTLEEPPPYVLFIFATTEPHKVLPTILSRCQRFDFRRIAVQDAVARLREICAAENIEADDDALLLIARKGDGALRDTLSAFDQSVALCGTTLHYRALAQALGVVEIDLFFAVTDAIAVRDTAALLLLVDRVVRRGYDLQEFLSGLQEHLRNLLVACTLPGTDLIEAAAGVQARYRTASESLHEADVLRLLALAADAEEAIKQASQPRLRLEMTLLKMAALASAVDLNAALDGLARLEALVREGQPLSTAPRVHELPSPRAAATAREPEARYAAEMSAHLAAEPAPEASASEAPTRSSPVVSLPDAAAAEAVATDALAAEEAVPVAPAEPRHASIHPMRQAAEQPSPAEDEGQVPEPGRPAASRDPYADLFGGPALKSRRAATPSDDAPAPPRTEGSAALASAPEALFALDRIEAAWPALCEMIERPALQAILALAQPVTYDNDVLVLTAPDAASARTIEGGTEAIVALLDHHLGLRPERLRCDVQAGTRSIHHAETAAAFDPLQFIEKQRREHPVVKAIFDQFGGEMVWQ